ncbi:DUF732 domain-containing protein [Mycobacterium sp.]|uniref:DUF732 domain-containing protein n=1 Tax=Mycobacterium sp. TaxID=1785 RepID=UPI003C71CE66
MGIYPGPGLSYSDMVSMGHQVVADVRAGASLGQEATLLAQSGKMTLGHAEYFAVAAIVVYGPELRPSDLHYGGSTWYSFYNEIWRMVYSDPVPDLFSARTTLKNDPPTPAPVPVDPCPTPGRCASRPLVPNPLNPPGTGWEDNNPPASPYVPGDPGMHPGGPGVTENHHGCTYVYGPLVCW